MMPPDVVDEKPTFPPLSPPPRRYLPPDVVDGLRAAAAALEISALQKRTALRPLLTRCVIDVGITDMAITYMQRRQWR
jgi:hypothetical protein